MDQKLSMPNLLAFPLLLLRDGIRAGPGDSSLQEHHNLGRAVIPPKTRNTPAKLTPGRLSCAQFSDSSEPADSELGDTEPDMPTKPSWIPSPAQTTTHQTARRTQQPSLATSVDRAHLLSLAAELESSQSLLAEKACRVGELEDKIKEMEGEMDFFRDLLQWEKKKTKAMEETVAKNGHRDMDADMAERDINTEASDSDPLKQKVEALDGTMRKMERQVEELQGRSTKGGWNRPPSGTKKNKEPSSSFPTHIKESLSRSRTHDPRPTTSLDSSRNASATSSPPIRHGNAGQALGSLLLTEVAAWSSMSNLLQQATSTRDQVFAMHTQSQTPDAQKSSQVSERMLRLCQEREIFLFNLSGLFSSLYGPIVEDNVLSSWNPYANTSTSFTGGAGNHKSMTEPIPRDDDDDIDHEMGDFGLDARIRNLHAELEETEDLRMKMLLRWSHTGGSRDDASDLYEDDDWFRGAISSSQLRKRIFPHFDIQIVPEDKGWAGLSPALECYNNRLFTGDWVDPGPSQLTP
ncbi:hypothetical protein ONZ45_g12595 [Pleurotus djamor]|nr:hypothetical protein ONZ45_g12595 [Pleurotus djamor]